jgi:pimeloyl-ACP methyl ester carboxylesterase
MIPTKSGYVDVTGITLYHEIYGVGEPLVLIHGGLTTIGEMQAWVQPLAKAWQVIALEMQGHGRTADTDRPMSFPTMGDDIAALLEHLEIPKADLVGHSFGGASAIRAAIQHPENVRLVVISSPYARSGWYPQAQRGMSRVGAAMAENMMQTPTGKFSKQWPQPERFPQFLDKMGKMMSEDYDWSAEIAKLPMPVLLVFADNDSVSQKHVAEFFALLGGGVKEPGWVKHAAVEVAAGGRAWLQPLQFHNLAGGAADCRQVPGRYAYQSACGCDAGIPSCLGPQQALIGCLPAFSSTRPGVAEAIQQRWRTLGVGCHRIFKFRVPVTSPLRGEIEDVPDRTHQIYAALLDLRGDPRMRRIEMVDGAVAISGEDRNRGILMTFPVLASKIVFERVISGA